MQRVKANGVSGQSVKGSKPRLKGLRRKKQPTEKTDSIPANASFDRRATENLKSSGAQ
jgi:hypothetical protein